MQYSFLVLLQSLSNDFLTNAANFLSLLGEESFLIVILLLIYYICDKKAGFSIFSSLLGAEILTNAVKAVVRAPRPFTVHPHLLADRLETATGYSFPSGHTTGAAAFYVAAARESGKKTLLVLSLILASLIGLSRNYLMVHWPVDVAAGMMIGLVFALGISLIFDRIYEERYLRVRFCTIYSAAGGVLALILTVLLSLNAADETAFSDLMKILSLSCGAYAGCLLETEKVNFKVCRSAGKGVANMAFSLIIILAIMGLKAVIPLQYYYPGSFVRYSLLGFWATGLYPLIAVKLKLLGVAETL